MIEQLETSASKMIGCNLSEKLYDQKYKTFVPAMGASLTEESKICLFVQSETSTAGICKPPGTISVLPPNTV